MARSLTLKRSLPILVPLVLAGSITALVLAAGRPEPTTAIELSGPMPVIDEGSINGMGRVDPSLYGGKVVLLNFWASWCAPCREEQPVLSRLWTEYRGRGVQFLGVDSMDLLEDGRAYLEEFGVAYPSVADPSSRIMRRFGVPYLPATVLVGTDGELRVRLVGAQSEASLREHLDDLLVEAGRTR